MKTTKLHAGRYAYTTASGVTGRIERSPHLWMGYPVWNVWVEGDMRCSLQSLSLRTAKQRIAKADAAGRLV